MEFKDEDVRRIEEQAARAKDPLAAEIDSLDDEFLTRDEILNANDLYMEDVEVPEWGRRRDGTSKKATVKVMTASERDAWEASLVTGSGKNIKISTLDIRAKLASLTLVNRKTGTSHFTLNDVAALGRKSAAAMDRVYEVAQRINKITDADVEELAKNSENGQPVDSSSP